MRFDCAPVVEDLPAAQRLGRGVAHLLGGRGVVALGHDEGDGSAALAEALATGLSQGGVSIVEVGPCDSPSLYFCCGSQQLAGSCMVTRPGTGPSRVKVCVFEQGAVRPITSDQERVILEAPEAPAGGTSQVVACRRRDDLVLDACVAHVATSCGVVGRLALAVNYDTAARVRQPLDRLVADRWRGVTRREDHPLDAEGHWPGPGMTNAQSARRSARRTWEQANAAAEMDKPALVAKAKRADENVPPKVDLGVVFRDDGDSVVFVDDEGEIVPPHLMTALLAGAGPQSASDRVICHALCSGAENGWWSWAPHVIEQEVDRLGGSSMGVEDPGQVAATMLQKGASLAGACPGYYHWGDQWFASSALVTLGRVLALLTAERRPLSVLVTELVRRFPRERLTDLEDWELTELVRFGNGDAFGVLHTRHYRSLVRSIPHNTQDAEDWASEAFRRLRVNGFQLDPLKNFTPLPWLLKTVRHIAADRREVPVQLDNDSAAATAPVEAEALARELRRDMRDAFRQLEEDQRLVVALGVMRPEDALAFLSSGTPPLVDATRLARVNACLRTSGWMNRETSLSRRAVGVLVYPWLSEKAAASAAHRQLISALTTLTELLSGHSPSPPGLPIPPDSPPPPPAPGRHHDFLRVGRRRAVGPQICCKCKRPGQIEHHLPAVDGATAAIEDGTSFTRQEPTRCRDVHCTTTHNPYWYRYTWSEPSLSWRRELLGVFRPG